MTPYMDETLDVAVVKLKRDIHKEFPPPLEYFEVLDPEKNDDEHIYLIGHDKGNKLHINYGIGLWNPTEKRLTDLVKFCQEYGKENGYKELDRKDRLVIQCKFVTGASGCPGVIIHGDKASVVLIYTRGYPDFYFSKNFPQKDKQAFPDEKLLQQGVNIGPVFESMTKNKTYLNLRNEIFPHQASEEQQQLNGQHQYAIDGAKKTNPESTFENVKDLDNHTTVRQETGNTTGNLTTCTDEGAKTAIPESVKCIRQVSYVLATGGKENLSLAYQQFENQGVQNITVNKSGLNINPDTNLDVNGDSTLRMPANPGKTRPMEHISIEEWIGNDMQAYKEKQLKEFELSLLSKAINVSKANSVALQLGLTQSDFEQFRHQGQTDLCYLILYKWRNKNGNGATLERLIGILFCAWESNNESVFTEDLKSAILRVMK
ncbi:uncharacterized protein LOC134705552 [Mytilus trossulus]|uniref:uncharacterized protein LOC134705552 n=1 Tax=Mytilus trossulus TaxID=6551 RepID=UPI003004E1B2